MKKQDFINMVAPGAQKSYQQHGVFASVTIAQGALETGWASSDVFKTDNNLFGIKFHGKHDPNLKISQGSRANDGGYYTRYQSLSDSIVDHGYFLRNNPRYSKAGAFTAKTPKEQITALKAAGYDTLEPDYVKYIMSIIDKNNLAQYDNGTYTGPSANTASQDGTTSNSIQDITVESTNYQIVEGSEKVGDVLFGRRCRITVSDDNGNAIDVSQLHCTFSIIKTIQMEPNTSEISIYNLNVETENFIIMSGKRVTVEAGYIGKQFGLIFDGDILRCIREKEDGTSYKLTIVALDSDRAINFDVANFSIMRGQTQRSIVEHISNKAQNPMNVGNISDKLSEVKLTRGKVLFGKSSDYLRQMAKSNGLQPYMDNGHINLVDLEELPPDEIIELNPKSGLIGVPEQTDYGISGQALLNPQIKLNSLIHVDSSLVRAKKIDFNSTNALPNEANATPSSGVGSNSAIVSIALKEEGTRESGNNNTKYGKWYGMNNVPWCAIFVSWCANQAGIPTDIIPKFASVSEGLSWFKGKGLFKAKGSYVPKAGDIFFNKSAGASHTGLVVSSDGTNFFTIEGNYNDKVGKVTRKLNSTQLTGFGTPNYATTGGTIDNVDFSSSDSSGGKTT